MLAAVASGVSCRQAAIRFGVSASSATRWRALERTNGDATPQPQGGDRRSERIERHAATILGLIDAERDMTLAEIRAALPARGASFGIATLQRFLVRRRITLKKRPRTPPNRTARTSTRAGSPGSMDGQTSTAND